VVVLEVDMKIGVTCDKLVLPDRYYPAIKRVGMARAA
jgi:hypothetical protein